MRKRETIEELLNANEGEVRLSIYAERNHDFSADICPKVTIDDMDDRAVENFRSLFIKHSENSRIATLSKEQLLRDCGVITQEGVTNAALILFGKPAVVARCLPHAEIIFEYRSTEAAGPAAQREEFCEGFFVQGYDKVWELVNLRNDKQHYQDRFQMLPVPTFNEHVVRESVLNAVAHREYQLGGSIFVRQYSRRLVVESPGGFPKGVDTENIIDQQSPRNYLIAKIFQLCGLVERSGQGMNLIYEMAVKEAKPLPDFTGSSMYSVKLTLDGQVIHTNMLAMLKKTDKNILDAITTADYVLLSKIYHGDEDIDLRPVLFKNLLDLGIAKKTELGLELMGGKLIVLVDDGDENRKHKITSVPNENTKAKLPKEKLNNLLVCCETCQSKKETFWTALDALVAQSRIIIDRPKGSQHPKFPDYIYPLDYGYLEDTSSMDDSGIDVWRGSDGDFVDAVVCTIDLLKRNSEIKILIGCTEEEKQLTIPKNEYMKGVLIRRDDL